MDHQPRPRLPAQKNQRDRLIRLAAQHCDWLLGFADAVWWSRLAAPALQAWQAAEAPMRLLEQHCPKEDSEPKALACYGLLVRATADEPERMWLRFVHGRPVSTLTPQFVAWCCSQAAAVGTRAVLLIWDTAAWHSSTAVQTFIRKHTQTVKQTGQGVRILTCRLPSKSPWLNPIAPKWLHGKRAVVEPADRLSATVLEARIYTYSGCEPEAHLVIPEKAA